MSRFAAYKARDTLAKVLYAQLFESIVLLINQAFKCDYKPDQAANITILDIAGFGKLLQNLWD